MDKQSEEVLKENYCKLGPLVCAEMLGITYRACVLRAYRLGIGNRRGARRSEIASHVMEWYSKKTAKECSEYLGISEQRVRSVASNLGVVGRRAKTRYSKSVNAEFFDTWTPESAYILGFIYADGSMSRDKISLFQNEIEHLNRIKNIMGIRPCVKKHGKRCHVISFNCCYLADRLRGIGIRERKSFGSMVYPCGLPDSLYCHFFRGFFDGDGSVGVYGKYKSLQIYLCGQKSFIEKVFNDTFRLIGTTGGGIRKATSKRDDFYCCSWGKKDDTRKIWEWIYPKTDILFLERKKKIMDRYFNKDLE
jgi:hypothetical protein